MRTVLTLALAAGLAGSAVAQQGTSTYPGSPGQRTAGDTAPRPAAQAGGSAAQGTPSKARGKKATINDAIPKRQPSKKPS